MAAKGKSDSESSDRDQTFVGRIKTLPGVIMVTAVTGVVGALIAYFVPGLLNHVTGADRLKVSVQTNPATIDTFADVSHHLIIPRGQRLSGGPGRGCTGFYPWGARLGGVAAGETNFRLVLQGGGDQTVVSGIRARVIARDPPLKGTGFVCPSQASLRPRSICIDLDEPTPIGEEVHYGTVAKRCAGHPVSFTVSANESEVLDVSAITHGCYCKWILELDTTQGGDERIVSVPGDGGPFETTAWPATLPGRPAYLWDPFRSTWTKERGTRSGPAIATHKTYPGDVARLPELATFAPGVRGGPLFQP